MGMIRVLLRTGDKEVHMQIRLTNYKAQVLIPVLGLLWAVSSWMLSMIWGYGLLQGTGPTAIVLGLLFCYDRWLWKFPVFSMLNTIPNLNGYYEGEIKYCFKGQDDTKKCELIIKQTCSNIKIDCTFNKDKERMTKSVSTEAFIKTDEIGDQFLYFYYHNPGSCLNGDTLDSHDGMNVLRILKDKKQIKLDGYYFTNRNPQTKGVLTVTRINGGGK